MSLPGHEASAEEVAAWVRVRLAELDSSPRKANWRYRALGMTVAEAIVDAPRTQRLELHVPVGEMRIINDVASARGLGPQTFTRRALGSWLVAVEEVEPEAIPFFGRGGMLGPR